MPPLRYGVNTRIKFVYGDLNFKVSGVQEAADFLHGAIKRSTNFAPVFQAFQPVWFDAIADAFEAGGDPVQWPALSPAYDGWKSGRHPGMPIMRLSDRLYESVTSQTTDTIWRVGPRSIQFSSRVPYFEYHQLGTSRMPARPVLTLPESAERTLLGMMQAYVLSGVTR